MASVHLQDREWIKIRAFLQDDPNAYIGIDEGECRRFVEGVLWITRSRASWQLLPAEYGKWNTVYKRFARWCDLGVWQRMLDHFADDLDFENGMIDSTIVRAHPCAAGAQKRGGQAAQALGRSWGGFSTKIHVTVDGLGNPLRLRLTAGQASDSGQAMALVEGLGFDRLLADRGYAGQEFYDWVSAHDMEPVIPPHPSAKNDKAQRPYDKWLYRERHLVECLSARSSIIGVSFPDSINSTDAIWASCTSSVS